MTEARNRGQGQEGLRFPVRYGLPVTAVTDEAVRAVTDLYYDVMFPHKRREDFRRNYLLLERMRDPQTGEFKFYEARFGSDFSMHTKLVAEPKWAMTRERALRFRAFGNVDLDDPKAIIAEEREKAFADLVDAYLVESGLGVELPPTP